MGDFLCRPVVAKGGQSRVGVGSTGGVGEGVDRGHAFWNRKTKRPAPGRYVLQSLAVTNEENLK